MQFEDIGSAIRTLRDNFGLSQAELSGRANIAQSTLSYIEAGKKSPTYDTLSAIAAGLNISMLDLLKFAEGIPSEATDPGLDPDMEQRLEAFSSLTADDFRRIAVASQLLYTQLKNSEAIAAARKNENQDE